MCVIQFFFLLIFRFSLAHHTQWNTFSKSTKTDDISRNKWKKALTATAHKKNYCIKSTNDIENERATDKITTAKANSERSKTTTTIKKIMSNRVIQHMETCKSRSKLLKRFTAANYSHLVSHHVCMYGSSENGFVKATHGIICLNLCTKCKSVNCVAHAKWIFEQLWKISTGRKFSEAEKRARKHVRQAMETDDLFIY